MEELREADKLVLVYEKVFADYVYLLPQLNGLLSKDVEYIRRSARERGIQFFVLDLPSLGKLLDRALSEGHYPPTTLAHTYALRHGSRCIPVFMGNVYLMIFGDNGCLRDDYSVEAIRFLRQVFYLAKKLHQPFSDESLHKSVQVLVTEDTELPRPERFWSNDFSSSCWIRNSFAGFAASSWYDDNIVRKSPQGPVSVVLRKLDLVSKLICRALGVYNPEEHRFRHGPGAISQISGPANKYQWYGWSERLESVYPVADCGFHNYTAWAGSTNDLLGGEYTPSSRLVAVPKTYNKPRLIAAEPSEHQWCQQNLWHYFCTRTKESWLSKFVRFNDQTLNQDLCVKGSLDGSLATIDLSSASDRVSCHAVGNFFRSNIGLLDALRATRTHVLHQTLNRDLPEELNLRKFSTMGSACTFPVESLLFLGVALASVLTDQNQDVTLENIDRLSEKVAVFGDDIIVPSTSRKLLQEALEVLDFRVNTDKSFSEGYFRESCGVDCYRGEYVTPVYLRTFSAGSPESVASVVESANNFYSLFLLQTAALLESTGPSGIATVRDDSGCFGYRSRVGTHFTRRRWNENLHREEVRLLSIKTAQDVVRSEDDSSLHQYFTESPSPLIEWKAGTKKRSKVKLAFQWVDVADADHKSAS